MANSVEYLGHCIDKNEIQALLLKVEAIVNAPQLANVQELRSFWVSSIVMENSFLIYPLNQLLQSKRK